MRELPAGIAAGVDVATYFGEYAEPLPYEAGSSLSGRKR